MLTTARYAIYFAPAKNSGLYEFGKQILGRTESDPVQRFNFDVMHAADQPAEAFVRQHTKPAAFYGFHATLKAPFTVKPELSIEALKESIRDFANRTSAIPLKGLAPNRYKGFTALSFAEQPKAVLDLASACVLEFEPFRQAQTKEEIEARVTGKSLNEKQREKLELYGYPHVLDLFNFHMTLSGRIEDETEQAEFLSWAEALYATYVQKTPNLNQLTLWYQSSRDKPFKQIDVFPLI